jgi:hypothetical protein
MRYYSGNIEPDENTIFVFGSNPEGRHGAGSAKVAKEKFGAVYGVGEGLQGNSYALPTKDLRIPGTRSISKSDIVHNIQKLYDLARTMPEKNFKVAYRTKFDEKSLNGYTGEEMVQMFSMYPVPNNIYFSEEWHDIFCQMHNYDGTYINHSGGAIGSDTVWGELSGQYGAISEHYWHGKRTENGNHEITEEEFNEGKEHVLEANKTLHRQPYKYMNLLARNWMQVKNSDEIFGIGQFKNKVVDGGTGWAVQMAIDTGKIVNFYDQDKCVWGRYSDGKWERSDTPVLTKNFAGIGTRKLNDNGWMAIKDVVIKTFEH